ncbi:MAG: hypothetical protein ABIN35_00020 [candidate division WOR-3 bacterium]
MSDYRESPPITCPHDTAHTIDPSQTIIYRTIGTNQTVVVDPFDGWYQSTSDTINIAAGNAGDVTNYDIWWPSNIVLWSLMLYFDPNAAGDSFSIIASPNTTIGLTLSDLDIGATTAVVSPTVFTHAIQGLDIAVSNNQNQNQNPAYQELGRITALNPATNTISFEYALTQPFPANCLIMLNHHNVRQFKIDNNLINTNGITFGNRLLIGKTIPSGTIIRIKYTNQSTTAKTLTYKIEYSIVP